MGHSVIDKKTPKQPDLTRLERIRDDGVTRAGRALGLPSPAEPGQQWNGFLARKRQAEWNGDDVIQHPNVTDVSITYRLTTRNEVKNSPMLAMISKRYILC